MTKELIFKFEAETTGAWRYYELDANGVKLPLGEAVIGTLYLRKKAIPEKNETIKVTLTIK